MSLKKNTLILMILTITLAAIVLSGCTTTTSPQASPGASTSAVTATTTGSTGNVPSGAPTVSTSGSVTTISGSQGGDFKVGPADGVYLFNIQAKDSNFELDYALANGGSEFSHPENLYAGTSGWYEQSFISSIPSKGQFRVYGKNLYAVHHNYDPASDRRNARSRTANV